MKIIKDSDGNETQEWEGVDWFWGNLGFGLLIFLLTIGIGGCVHLAK